MSDPLAWLTAAAMTSKTELIAEDGIGENLDSTVVAFDDDGEVLGWAELVEPAPDPVGRLRQLVAAAVAMRSYWHAASLALMIESFTAQRDGDSPETDLAQRFADGDQRVQESLTLIWAHGDGRFRVATLPYRIGYGRAVIWLESHMSDNSDAAVNGVYPDALSAVLREAQLNEYLDCESPKAQVVAAASQIHALGFHVVLTMPPMEWLGWFDDN